MVLPRLLALQERRRAAGRVVRRARQPGRSGLLRRFREHGSRGPRVRPGHAEPPRRSVGRLIIKPRHILGVGWLLVLLYAFPGFMSTDSIDQLTQARTGVYTDWHPPLMALVWKLLDGIVSGPVLMLVLQTGLFLFGSWKLLE